VPGIVAYIIWIAAINELATRIAAPVAEAVERKGEEG
jgi:hypothetical protein